MKISIDIRFRNKYNTYIELEKRVYYEKRY